MVRANWGSTWTEVEEFFWGYHACMMNWHPPRFAYDRHVSYHPNPESCLRWLFTFVYGFYHGHAPWNYHLGDHFFQPPNQQILETLVSWKPEKQKRKKTSFIAHLGKWNFRQIKRTETSLELKLCVVLVELSLQAWRYPQNWRNPHLYKLYVRLM